MTDIVQFLERCLAEDEKVARAAYGHEVSGLSQESFDFLLLWGQATRVFCEVDAKRQQLRTLLDMPHYAWYDYDEYGCPVRVDSEPGAFRFDNPRPCDCGRDAFVARMLGLLALPYAGRDGFDEAWRP